LWFRWKHLMGTGHDFMVISLTTAGDTNWTYRYNGSANGYDFANSIVYGLDGNIYAAGHSVGEGTFYDFTVISIDTTGTENWVYTYNGPGNEEDFANSIVYGSDENIYAAGRSVGMGTSNDFMVISLTTAGDTNWTYRYNGSANQWDIAKSIVYGPDGNLYVAGYASNLVTSKDFTVISLDTTGAENWVYGYSAASSFYWDEANSVAYGLDGNIYAAGYSIYSTGAGIWDFTVISLGSVGVEEETALRLVPHALRLLVVYPNPFKQITDIRYQIGEGVDSRQKSVVSMKIYDASGRLVKDFSLPSAYCLVPTEVSWNGVDNAGQKLPAGVYFLKFAAGDYKETRKVLLIK
ncbi:T9SS type A sorting domain-containing protein, partial [candidate division WOR-3 bacterium]|nr:T9SS type A sorting domain-containing protein [candidate division WOR-3 bacterium]